MANYVGWKGAAAFAGGSMVLLAARIILLVLIRDYFQEIPALIVTITVIFPAFCVFTALGFHRDFYKSYIPHELRGVKAIYSSYVSIVALWLGICVLLFLTGGLLLGEDLNSISIVCSLIIVDRIQDEKMRFYFFTKRFIPWFTINIMRTIAPIIICVVIWDASVLEQWIIILVYCLSCILVNIPRIFCKYIRLPRASDVYTSFGKQGTYSFASQLRRNLDRLLAIPILGSELAFSYNILVQLASGSVLVFEKFINVLERQSYLKRNQRRLKINRFPFFIIGTGGVLLVTLFDERVQAIQNIHMTLILLCALCWIISLCDREFEFNWWKGNIAAYVGSFVSVGLSLVILVSVFIFRESVSLVLAWYVCAFLFVPLVLLFWIKGNGFNNE